MARFNADQARPTDAEATSNGCRVGRLWVGAAALRDYCQLYPSCARIHAVLPEITPLPPPSGVRDALPIARTLPLRRVRITVWTLDGYATLRPLVSTTVTAYAQRAAEEAGRQGDRQTAMVEAVVIGAALASRLDGATPADGSDDTPAQLLGPPEIRPPGNLGAADQVT
ncbi:DUF6545 domain-containing protein [Micromonospora sp. DT31]|uniref:DUF6545 domain-containing protein n=1 Tax=Micromonospora sp. DT31 TaxID=3393434 RepID=UPI003CF46684